MLGILIITHVGAMEDVHDLAVDAARHQAQFAPNFLARFWSALGHRQFAGLLAELGDADLSDVDGDLLRAAIGCDNAQFLSQSAELLGIADLVTLRLTLCCGQECKSDIPTVIGV